MNAEALNRVVLLLRTNGFNAEADMLEDLAAKYYLPSDNSRKEIANKIKEMCHPKWLGDVYINNLSLKEWYGLLDKLSKSV